MFSRAISESFRRNTYDHNNRDLNISIGHQKGPHFAYITLPCTWDVTGNVEIKDGFFLHSLVASDRN